MKIFEMQNPSLCVGEWWIGENIEACMKAMQEEYGWNEEELAEFMECFTGRNELSDEVLHSMKFQDDDGTERTFKEQRDLELKRGGVFPRIFASTEY